MDTPFLTVQQAAQRAGVSESLVYEWCKKKLLPHYRLGVNGAGGKILIDPDDFDGFLASCKVMPGPDDGDDEDLKHIR